MALTAAQLLVRVGADTSQAEAGLQRVGRSVESAAATMAKTGASMSAAFTLPLVAAGAAVFKVGADFESAFTGVIKTFSGTAEEAEVLRQGIRDMATELPATAVEIAAVAESAGALGIAGENVLGFTRTVIDMAEATDLTADQAANDMARIANIMQMPQTEFERMGSTIVALGNSGASTESEIVSMAERIAGAGSVIGLTEAQVLGWASAMSSVGINAEAGGTAFSRVVVDIAKDVQTGGKNLSKFAKIAGVSSEAFVEAFEEDASAATLTFVEGLGEIADAGGNVFGVLEELGLSDVRVQDTLLRLAGAGDLVTDSLNTANTAWEENLALSREAELRYATTESKVKILKNTLSELGISLFDTFKPKIDAALDSVSGFAAGLGDTVKQFATANPEIVNAALAFAGVLAAAGPVLLMLSGLGAAIGFLLSPIGLVVAALATLAAGLAYLDTLGVIDLTTMWTNVKTAIQGAIDTLADWRTQIETQGLISEETFIATWELPPAAREFMQFVIGLGAAFKTLKAAITGEDLGAGRLRELNTILESAFGSEIATRIENIAFHIKQLKDNLSGATTVGEWVRSLSQFGRNVGVEIKGIAVEIKKQIEAEIIKLNISGLWQEVQVQFDAIPWHTIDVNTAALIDAVAAQLGKGNWQPAGERAGKAIVEPFKTGIFAGFAAAVASQDWEPEQPLWDKALGNLNRIFWTRVGELFSGTLEGMGIDLPEHKLLSEAAAKQWQESGNIVTTGILEAGARIHKAFYDTGALFGDAGQQMADQITEMYNTVQGTINRILGLGAPGGGPVKITEPLELGMGSLLRLQEQMRQTIPMRERLPRIPGGGGSQEWLSPLQTFPEDIKLSATIEKTTPAAGLEPIQLKAMITATEDVTTGKMGDTLTKGAATIGSALAGFQWPDLPDWTWPPYNPFKWSPYNPWIWPPIPAPSWLNRMVVPRPTWLGELLSWSPQVVLRQQAVTTPGQIASVAAAGEGMVGAAAVGSGGVTITGDVYVRDELDLEQLAMRITQIQNRRS